MSSLLNARCTELLEDLDRTFGGLLDCFFRCRSACEDRSDHVGVNIGRADCTHLSCAWTGIGQSVPAHWVQCRGFLRHGLLDACDLLPLPHAFIGRYGIGGCYGVDLLENFLAKEVLEQFVGSCRIFAFADLQPVQGVLRTFSSLVSECQQVHIANRR